MNLTLSVDERTIRDARKAAEAMGKSLNQLVREYLESVANRANRDRWADELDRLSRPPRGHSKGWRFNRDEIHERA
jgi:hypothetical protein